MEHRLHEIVRMAELGRFVGLQRTQIQQLIAKGAFPRPVRLSQRRLGFLKSELIEWQQARIAQSREVSKSQGGATPHDKQGVGPGAVRT